MGPREPAVMELVLSDTGAPAAVVSFLSWGIKHLLFR
jgi:hypothetical protein